MFLYNDSCGSITCLTFCVSVLRSGSRNAPTKRTTAKQPVLISCFHNYCPSLAHVRYPHMGLYGTGDALNATASGTHRFARQLSRGFCWTGSWSGPAGSTCCGFLERAEQECSHPPAPVGLVSPAQMTSQHHQKSSAIYLGLFCPPDFKDARGLLDSYQGKRGTVSRRKCAEVQNFPEVSSRIMEIERKLEISEAATCLSKQPFINFFRNYRYFVYWVDEKNFYKSLRNKHIFVWGYDKDNSYCIHRYEESKLRFILYLLTYVCNKRKIIETLKTRHGC